MAIRIKGKEPEALRVGKRPVAALYLGARLIWEGVKSCFGSGVWRDDKPWRDDDGWR